MRKTLLLNQNFEVISFISERKTFKLLFKEKVEVVSEWEDEIINTPNLKFKFPAILKLKSQIRRSYFQQSFSRKMLVKRDNSKCMYCDIKLSPSKVTIDHVLPRFLGGVSSFSNCVVACQACNGRKANLTLEQSGMKLLRKPMFPSITTQFYMMENHGTWHDDWNNYIITY